MTFYTIIALMALGQLIILLVNSVKYLKNNSISRFFLLLLLCLGFILFHELIIHNRYILKIPHFTFTGEALTLIIWPLIYIISKKILNIKVRPYDILHLLPFVIYSVYRFNDYGMPGIDKYNLLVDFYSELDSEQISVRPFVLKNFLWDFVLFRLQPLVYILVLLNSLRSKLKPELNLEERNSKVWLRLLIYGFLLLWITKYVLFILGYIFTPISVKNPIAILFIAIEVFLISQLALTDKEGIPKSFIKKKKRGSKALEEIAEKAKEYVINEKAFLNSELTLQKLAKVIETNANYLSKAINTYHDKSFSDFINTYRIGHAKQLIQLEDYKLYTLEAIARESGFKSVSTFNRSFYKLEGMTPSNFKNNMQFMN